MPPHYEECVHTCKSTRCFPLFLRHFAIHVLACANNKSTEARLLVLICTSIKNFEGLPDQILNLLIFRHPLLLHIKELWIARIFRHVDFIDQILVQLLL